MGTIQLAVSVCTGMHSQDFFHTGLMFQVWQMAENIYNDEEPETPASELESGAS